MKKYRALFLAGDASLFSKDFYTPKDFKETTIILELMEMGQDLVEKYGCPVSVKVYLLEDPPSVVPEIQSSRHWWKRVVTRISSFFSL